MADLKLLTERVVEKEKAVLRQKVEQAKVEAEKDIEASQAAEVAARKQQKEAVKEKVEKEYNIKTNTLKIKKRDKILSAKQNILNKIFVDANHNLNNLDEETFQTFVIKVLRRFENEKKVTLIFGEESKNLVSAAWVKANAPQSLVVHVSDDSIPNKSGLIVEKDGIDYNFIFDTLVEEIKSDVLSEISNELF